jgi:hypothetical protein
MIIYDSEGMDVSSDALGYSAGNVSIINVSYEDSTEYTFEIVPGFAHESSSAEIKLTEFTTFRTEYSFNVVSDRRTSVTLYPSLPKQLEIYFDIPTKYYPEDAEPVGKIIFESTSNNKTEYELPIKFKF